MIASLSFDLCISNLPIVLAKDLDAFEARRVLIAYYFMWHTGHPAPEQLRGVRLGYIAGPRAVLYSFS